MAGEIPPMSTLILHLPLALPGPHTEYRYTLSLDGHSASGHATARAALLPAASETVAVVPVLNVARTIDVSGFVAARPG